MSAAYPKVNVTYTVGFNLNADFIDCCYIPTQQPIQIVHRILNRWQYSVNFYDEVLFIIWAILHHYCWNEPPKFCKIKKARDIQKNFFFFLLGLFCTLYNFDTIYNELCNFLFIADVKKYINNFFFFFLQCKMVYFDIWINIFQLELLHQKGLSFLKVLKSLY